MTNKKIASEIAVGIILLFTIVVGGIFWLQSKKENLELSRQRESAIGLEFPQPSGELSQPQARPTDVAPAAHYDGSKNFIIKNWAPKGNTAIFMGDYSGTGSNEIVAFNLENKVSKILLSDKGQPFFIDSGDMVSDNILAVKVSPAGVQGMNYKYINLENGSTTEGPILPSSPVLPVPTGFVSTSLDNHNYAHLPVDHKFIYTGSRTINNDSHEEAVFSANDNWLEYKKIYSTSVKNSSEGITMLAASPDGAKIAFTYGRTSMDYDPLVNNNVFVMNSDGSNLKEIDVNSQGNHIVDVLRFTDNDHIFIERFDNKSKKSYLLLTDLNGKMKELGEEIHNQSGIISRDGTVKLGIDGINGMRVEILKVLDLFNKNKDVEIIRSEDRQFKAIGWYAPR